MRIKLVTGRKTEVFTVEEGRWFFNHTTMGKASVVKELSPAQGVVCFNYLGEMPIGTKHFISFEDETKRGFEGLTFESILARGYVERIE